MHRYERQKQSPSPHLPTNYNPAGLDITKPIYRATRSPRVLRRTARTESIDFDNDIKEDGFAEEIQVRSLNANDCVPKKIRITARSNVSPDVLQYNLTLSSRNSAKTIIRKSWGSDFEEVRGVVFNGLAPRTAIDTLEARNGKDKAIAFAPDSTEQKAKVSPNTRPDPSTVT
ncbi:hypothetical protein KEM55_005234 [Ascosphaera atra]|nr:hypothetical protein KEM55_005234 [Ascosphaera atra]